ncbi:MAG: tetratricopeptide repeat protein [Patescibacteria group bacterium]|nr:tetratricopeptide repeat protein [Patescibacteria group bacterium]
MLHRILSFINIALIIGLIFLVGKTLYTEYFFQYIERDSLSLQNTESEIQKSPLSWEEAIAEADTLREQEVITLALGYYKKAQKIDSSKAESYIGMAKTYILTRDYHLAEENIRIALLREPENTRAQTILAYIELRQGYIAKAKESLKKSGGSDEALFLSALIDIYDLKKENFDTHFNSEYGYQLEPLKKQYQMWQSYQGSSNTHLSAFLAQGLYEIGEYELSREMAKNIVIEKPDYRDAWLILGMNYLALELYQNAEESFIEAKKNTIYAPEIDFYLGYGYMMQKDYDRAFEHFVLAEQKGFADKVYLYETRAKLAEKEGRFEKSYEYLLKKIDAQEYVNPHEYIGIISLLINELNDPKKAQEHTEKLLIQYPKSGTIYNLHGWTLLSQKKYEAAFDYLQKALSLDDKNPAIHLNLGIYYSAQGDNYEAITHYKKAFDLDPTGSIGDIASHAYNRLIKLKE